MLSHVFSRLQSSAQHYLPAFNQTVKTGIKVLSISALAWGGTAIAAPNLKAKAPNLVDAKLSQVSSEELTYTSHELPRWIEGTENFSHGQSMMFDGQSAMHVSYVDREGVSYTDTLEIMNNCRRGPLCERGFMTMALYEHKVRVEGPNYHVDTQVYMINKAHNQLMYVTTISVELSTQSQKAEIIASQSTGEGKRKMGSFVSDWSSYGKSYAVMMKGLSHQNLAEEVRAAEPMTAVMMNAMIGAGGVAATIGDLRY
jgi:hypothetical protein